MSAMPLGLVAMLRDGDRSTCAGQCVVPVPSRAEAAHGHGCPHCSAPTMDLPKSLVISGGPPITLSSHPNRSLSGPSIAVLELEWGVGAAARRRVRLPCVE